MRVFGAILCLSCLSPLLVHAQNSAKTDPNRIGDRKVSGTVNFYSLEKEIALGRQLAIEVEKQARIVEDPIIAEYINRLGQNLARNSDTRFPVSFKLIDSEEINAFTLPGGHIFVSTGLFKLSDNEAELASAIAHELGHAAARHSTRLESRNQLVSFATLPLILLGPAASSLSSAAAPMALFKFSREFESEADLLGLEYLWKAGYDPNASVDLFERVESTEKRTPGRVSRLFQTHPPTEDRLAKTQDQIQTLLPARGEYVINTSEYEAIRERLSMLTPKPAAPPKPTLLRPSEQPQQ